MNIAPVRVHPNDDVTLDRAKSAANGIATLAVLFADVCDSTRLYETMGDAAAFNQIKVCLNLLTDVTRQFGGWTIKSIGDGIMCAFPGADAAAQAACEMQTRLAQMPQSRDKARITIRVGFHFGNVLLEGKDVYGDTVNVAARIAALATPSHVTMTAASAAQLSPNLKSRVRKLTALPVKGKQEAIDVCEITWQNAGEETFVPGRTGSLVDMIEARLHIEYQRRKFVFRNTLTLGRDKMHDIMIDDLMASRNHARIEKRKEQFVLVDQSTNGTYVMITGREEIALRRSEFVLYGQGLIAFGDSPGDRPDAPVVRYFLESPGTLRSGG